MCVCVCVHDCFSRKNPVSCTLKISPVPTVRRENVFVLENTRYRLFNDDNKDRELYYIFFTIHNMVEECTRCYMVMYILNRLVVRGSGLIYMVSEKRVRMWSYVNNVRTILGVVYWMEPDAVRRTRIRSCRILLCGKKYIWEEQKKTVYKMYDKLSVTIQNVRYIFFVYCERLYGEVSV